MFDEAFTKLEIDEIAILLDHINKDIDGSVFDPLETTILAINVPFYQGYRFLNIADHATNPPLQRFIFQKNDTNDFVIIDWTYKTIYALNKAAPISLNDDNVLEYVRFFFSHVKGRHGNFIVCESLDSIQWKDEPTSDIRKKVADIVVPLNIKEKRKNGTYIIEAFMMLKDSLFKVDIYVEQNGKVVMSDHEILLEKLPVLDSVIG